jgi:DpnII restriction endonuclease
LYESAVSAPSLASILQTFEDELFFATLDVALDIDQALVVQSAESPVYIDGIRDVIRYQILYPVHSVNLAYRYADLRSKALKFLQKQSAIGSMEYHKWGISGWEGRWAITVPDENRFVEFLEALKIEEERRNPGQKIQTDIHSATARLVQLADSFSSVARTLEDRRSGREPLLIQDEYDVQYIFGALLTTRFDDVRPEDWIPSYAGSASRVDFFLKNESVFFETKMTRGEFVRGSVGSATLRPRNAARRLALPVIDRAGGGNLV